MTMTNNMACVPKAGSGTKCPKMTTPQYRCFRTSLTPQSNALWNGVLQVQLYISLPDNIFEKFLKKQNHSLVPLTFCTINHKRWYSFSTRHARETLLHGNTTEIEKYRYFSCIKNPKNRCSNLMFPYFSF